MKYIILFQYTYSTEIYNIIKLISSLKENEKCFKIHQNCLYGHSNRFSTTKIMQ